MNKKLNAFVIFLCSLNVKNIPIAANILDVYRNGVILNGVILAVIKSQKWFSISSKTEQEHKMV